MEIALLKIDSLSLNGIVTAHPCAVPFGQPTADQKYSWHFCLKNLTSNDVHGCTNAAIGRMPIAALYKITQTGSFGHVGRYSRYLSKLLCQISQKFHSSMQYPGWP